jgi:hypothetical protein
MPTEHSTPDNPGFQTPQELLNALYQSLSGFKGARDESFFRSLFVSGATIGMLRQGNLRSGSPEDFLEISRPLFASRDFFERQVKETVLLTGHTAMVASVYETSSEPFLQSAEGAVQSGVNYLSLVNREGRWWIFSLLWEVQEAPSQKK